MTNEATSLERLEKSLFELSDIYRKHQEYIKTKYNVTGLEMEIIQLVIVNGPQRMKDIGDHFRVKLSTLTSIIDKIERNKLVKRVNSKSDRRVVYLEAARKGKTLYQSYSNYIQVIATNMKESMPEAQFEAFIEGLEKVSYIVSAGDHD